MRKFEREIRMAEAVAKTFTQDGATKMTDPAVAWMEGIKAGLRWAQQLEAHQESEVVK